MKVGNEHQSFQEMKSVPSVLHPNAKLLKFRVHTESLLLNTEIPIVACPNTKDKSWKETPKVVQNS